MKNPDSGATFEPAIEYVGNRTIVAVLRDMAGMGDPAGDRHTWQTVSTDMGVSFSPLVDILDLAHVEQYTFGEQRAQIMIESDRDGDGSPDADSGWLELYNGSSVYSVSGLSSSHWRLRLRLSATAASGSPRVVQVRVTPR